MTTLDIVERLRKRLTRHNQITVDGDLVKEIQEAADEIERLRRAPDLAEALRELLRCANAIVGANMYDPNAAEAFEMFNNARLNARRTIASLSRPSVMAVPRAAATPLASVEGIPPSPFPSPVAAPQTRSDSQ